MKFITEKDAVLRERAAYEAGIYRAHADQVACTKRRADTGVYTWRGDAHSTYLSSDAVTPAASEAYPLQSVTRARVLKNEAVFGSAYEFTVIDGGVKERLYGGSWKTPSGWSLTAAVIRAWADLLAHPTEETDA